MLSSVQGKKCVMRAKIDYASKNGALRDPNLYRCVEGNHYRLG
jgi:glutamyl-tRNA synthetase